MFTQSSKYFKNLRHHATSFPSLLKAPILRFQDANRFRKNSEPLCLLGQTLSIINASFLVSGFNTILVEGGLIYFDNQNIIIYAYINMYIG